MTYNTSALARDSVAPLTGSMREHVLGVIRAAGLSGATCDEIEAELGMPHQTASARVNELERNNLIHPAGRRRTRSGRWAQIYLAGPGDEPATVKAAKKCPHCGEPL